MVKKDTQPTIKLPRGCRDCQAATSSVHVILRNDSELAEKVGKGPVKVTSRSFNPEFPSGCAATAKANRRVIFENLEIACPPSAA